MKNKSFEIYSDCLDILERLKEIDSEYFVLFNVERNVLELHNRSQADTFCLTLPYESLDERTLVLARRTRSERRDALILELDAENERALQDEKRRILNDAEAKLYDC